MVDWQRMDTAPRDGRLIWGFLYDSGVRLLRWSGEAEFGEWVEAAEPTDDWSPTFWAPFDAITLPPGVFYASGSQGKVRLRDLDEMPTPRMQR